MSRQAQSYQSFECNSTGNYTLESAYQQNLELALKVLADNASLTGYYTTTTGYNPDTVYAMVQCRGFLSTGDCRKCAANITGDIREVCPSQKEAFIWNENCYLQYSDWLFFSATNINNRLCLLNLANATEPTLFSGGLRNLIKSLSSVAASNSSRLAFGRTVYNGIDTLYAMVQCSKGITGNDCLNCLQQIVTNNPQCVDKNVGGQLIALSCYIRYEIYQFFSLSLLSESSPPPLFTQPSSDPSITNGRTSQSGKKSKTILTVIIPVSVAFMVTTIILLCFFRRKIKKKRTDGVAGEVSKSMELLSIELEALRVATDNFSDECKLGQGGFGPVYKGKLWDGREIAVKRLSSTSRQGLEELKTEVKLVAKLQHRNLVRLIGFCLEEEEKLLVYEYLPNGSLDNILFDTSREHSLEWEKRYKIIIGIARALVYLHEDSQLRIIHRDLKVSNILLDKWMNPKISDFGLAKLFPGSQTQANTNRIAGTYGYMAPEYAKKGHFSTKSDVYSFGVLVLEVVTGRKNSSFLDMTNLQSYAWEHWVNATALDLLDPSLGYQCSTNEVLKCIHIALLCVQNHAADRPRMSEIILMLSSYGTNPPTPLKPGFFVTRDGSGSNSIIEDSEEVQSSSSRPKLLHQSVNGVTISELDPR
ncbi:hypothetical protein K2173_018889 [Erythroxylum novogranatense]|uniref:Cysteine-rich receptor-like protein kinase n=1 Tax=Erythroxylum novogranatense TaxID=1862640 RepID=A0AAV8SB14_9ROSI|nr:hypothetical protein K2173_018889 [Erythroxylum novogranatense]